MNIFYASLITLAALASLVLAMAGFPGSFLLWLTIFLISLAEGFNIIGPSLLVLFFLICSAGELLEYLSGVIGAKKSGGGAASVRGALIGGLTGAVILSSLIPLWGFFIGVFLGTFSGAFIGEYNSKKDFYSSARVGMGALAARVGASGIKVLIILVISSISAARHMGFF